MVCFSAVDSQGQTIWIVGAHRDGKRFIVRADEKLTAFLELELVIRVISPPTQSSNSLLSFFDIRRALTIFQLPASSNFKVKRKRDPELRA